MRYAITLTVLCLLFTLSPSKNLNAQHVGINIENPMAPLHILGSGEVMRLQSTEALNETFGDLLVDFWGLRDGDLRKYGSIGIPGSNENFLMSGSYGVLLSSGFGQTEVFLDDESTGVYIGDNFTFPQATLDVDGDLRSDSIGVGLVPREGLHVDDDLNVLFGQDTTSITDKLMWWPSKSAFRAGRATSNWWQPAQLAQYSFGGGKGNPAGFASVAFGFESEALDSYAFAAGFESIASMSNSFAFGNRVLANGLESIAIGNNVEANSAGEIAFGYFNVASSPIDPTSKDDTDPLFAIGNGTFSTPSNALTVLKNGFMGIGTPTPERELHINLDDSNGGMILEGDQATTQVNINLDNNHSEGGRNYVIRSTGGTAGSGGGKLLIGDVDAGASRLAIDSSGNVGINTASPGYKLDVNGDGNFSGTASGDVVDVLTLENTSGSSNSGAALQYLVGGDIVAKIYGDAPASSDIDGALAISILDNEVLEEKIRILTNGTFRGRSLQPWSDDEYTVGTALRRYSTIYSTNGTIQTSDRNLKTEIRDLNYGLDAVRQLRPVQYQWKNNPGKDKLGLIAQELAPVIPEVVLAPESEEEYYGVNYADLVPVLIKSVQDLDRANAELRQIVQQQQVQINALMGNASVDK